MSQTLHQLADQAEQLHQALQQAADSLEQYEYNLTGVQRCAERIAQGMRQIGNERMAALSARDRRKVMEQMQDAVDELMELLSP